MQRKSLGSCFIFAGSLLCFLFPFVTLSCGSQPYVTLTGVNLALGTTLDGKHIRPDVFTLIAIGCTVAGLVLSLIGRRLALATAASGGTGAICLLAMNQEIQYAFREQGLPLHALFEDGFFLCLALLIVGTVWNLWLETIASSYSYHPAPPPPPPKPIRP